MARYGNDEEESEQDEIARVTRNKDVLREIVCEFKEHYLPVIREADFQGTDLLAFIAYLANAQVERAPDDE